MKTNFEIIEKEIGNVVEIEETVSMMKLPTVMGNDFKRIMEYIKSNNSECTGAPYARYLDIDWEKQTSKSMLANIFDAFTKKWHFMVGVPSSTQLAGEEELKPKYIETQNYAKAIHIGPYQKVGKTYKNLYAWIKAQNLSAVGESIEIYINNPRETKKEDLETIVLIH